MNRRELTAGAAHAAFAGVASPFLSQAALAASSPWDKVIETATHCLTSGLLCEAHCQELLSRGDKSMAECNAAVRDMLVACEAIVRLAAYGSKHAKTYAKACAEVCDACALACEKHKAMPICKTCLDSCKACAKACRDAAA